MHSGHPVRMIRPLMYLNIYFVVSNKTRPRQSVPNSDFSDNKLGKSKKNLDNIIVLVTFYFGETFALVTFLLSTVGQSWTGVVAADVLLARTFPAHCTVRKLPHCDDNSLSLFPLQFGQFVSLLIITDSVLLKL